MKEEAEFAVEMLGILQYHWCHIIKLGKSYMLPIGIIKEIKSKATSTIRANNFKVIYKLWN